MFPDVDVEKANNVWKAQLAAPAKEEGKKDGRDEDDD